MTPEFKRVLQVTSFAEEERAPDFDEFIGCLNAHGVEFANVTVPQPWRR